MCYVNEETQFLLYMYYNFIPLIISMESAIISMDAMFFNGLEFN